MKNRLLAYLILLPLILLLSTVSIKGWFVYAIMAVWGLCAVVLIVALGRTKYLSKIKKGLAVLVMAAVFCIVLGQQAFALKYSDEEFREMGEKIVKITNVPKEYRTNDQIRDLDETVKKYKEAAKERKIGKDSCPSTRQLTNSILNDCWLCDLVFVIVEATDKLATSFLNTVRDNDYALMLLAFGFAFWLVMRTLGFIMTLGMGDVGAYISDMFKRLLLVIVVAGILYMPVRSLVDLFVTPVFTFSASLVSSIQSANTSEMSAGERFNAVLIQKTTEGRSVFQCPYCRDLSENAPAVPAGQERYARFANSNLSRRVISPAFRNSLLCITCNVYAATAPATVLGEYLTCAGIKNSVSIPYTPIKFYSPQPFFLGVILTLCFFLISALFVFPLIENFFRVGFVIVLLPFFVVAYVFPSTRAYSKRAFQLLIYAMFVFLAISIFLVVLMEMFNSLFLGKGEKVATLVANNDAEGLVSYLGFSGSAVGMVIFYGSIFLVFVAWGLYKTLDEFCRTLTGISLTSAGGFEAVQSTWSGLKGTHSVIDTVYSARWAHSRSAEQNMKDDARVRGANKFHSTEAASRAIRSKTTLAVRRFEPAIRSAGNRFGDKAENFVNQKSQRLDRAIGSTGQKINSFLRQKATNAATQAQSPNASRLSKVFNLFKARALFASTYFVRGVARTGRVVGLFAGVVIGKVSKYTGIILGSVVAGSFKAVGLRLARSKYYHKTAALLTYTLPRDAKAVGAGATGVATSALLGGISGYQKLLARLKKNKNGQGNNSNGQSNGTPNGQGNNHPPKGKFVRAVEKLNIKAWRHYSKNTYRTW